MALDTAADMAANMPAEMLEQMKKTIAMNMPKGIIYSNFSFMTGEELLLEGEEKYQKFVRVEETDAGANLEISIVDLAASMEAAEENGVRFGDFE